MYPIFHPNAAKCILAYYWAYSPDRKKNKQERRLFQLLFNGIHHTPTGLSPQLIPYEIHLFLQELQPGLPWLVARVYRSSARDATHVLR